MCMTLEVAVDTFDGRETPQGRMTQLAEFCTSFRWRQLCHGDELMDYHCAHPLMGSLFVFLVQDLHGFVKLFRLGHHFFTQRRQFQFPFDGLSVVTGTTSGWSWSFRQHSINTGHSQIFCTDQRQFVVVSIVVHRRDRWILPWQRRVEGELDGDQLFHQEFIGLANGARELCDPVLV